MTPPGAAAAGNDQDLVARAQRGDVTAFKSLYQATSGRVYALCVRMCGDRDRATELLQDVFVRIWERIGSYRGESAFTTWAHRLAVNVVLESQRREKRLHLRVEFEGDGETSSLHGATARTESVAERIDLERAVAGLPPGARQVFVLHDIEGYQHNEIAKMTGLAEGTLRAQLHRARRLLMEALNR